MNERKANKLAQREPLGNTHVSLKHVVVLLLGAERLLEHGDVALIVRVLLLQGLHLRGQRKDFLVSLLNLQPGLLQLHHRERNGTLTPFSGSGGRSALQARTTSMWRGAHR
ncbi:hypothetical protein E2C01_025911 [Portunus trituberculatus]|uniref:Uncharacterized protein n=1 Tax=Portunus trituberculatus TaxID=210409 RepID=A0A5B7EJ85_PORTR|nr:hypothetical protein [Portunus trituberculatus]